MTKDFLDRGLIINERLEEYDGTTAVVRTEHVSAEEVEYMRWKAERAMKGRYLPPAFLRSPLFILRNLHRMFSHTYRGCTLKTFLGLEDEHEAFARYRTLRVTERAYL